MKKIQVFYFNDGDDGVIVAKSLKQAYKIMIKNEIFDSINEINEWIKTNDIYIEHYKKAKRMEFKKSEFLGWIL